ncbi:MAG: polysaccharide deacetylase family protein [Candidatus Margulisiibacteriota bacterium]
MITIDLCPSSKPYEKKLFDALDAWGMKKGKSIPVYVCVAGKWIGKHPADLAAIKAYKHLKIVWVNHSYTHPVENGFLDNPKINFTSEVYVNYEYMQSYDLQPSKYFRFPGLVHNPERLVQLQKMGFVNLDADAWLGKGQPIKDGSIILIHGNGNESPLVVKEFIRFVKGYKGEIRSL